MPGVNGAKDESQPQKYLTGQPLIIIWKCERACEAYRTIRGRRNERQTKASQTKVLKGLHLVNTD